MGQTWDVNSVFEHALRLTLCVSNGGSHCRGLKVDLFNTGLMSRTLATE